MFGMKKIMGIDMKILRLFLYASFISSHFICGALTQWDTTFGAAHNGKVITPVSSDAQAMGLLLQADGKSIVLGNCMTDETSYLAVVRYTTDGILDANFADQGVFTTSIEGGLVGNEGVLQADGKIVVAGTVILSDGQPNFAVARLSASGSLDNDFGSSGIAIIPVYGSSTSISVAADNKIIVAGSSAQRGVPVLVLTRLLSDGTVDTSFGDNGYKTVALGTRFQDGALALDVDGKIVVTGYSIMDDIQQIVVLRFTADGALDGTFGDGGLVKTAVPNALASQAYALDIQADGKIVVVGSADDNCVVLRYKPDGLLDETFGTEGVQTLMIGNLSASYAIRIQSDEKIVIVGGSDEHSFLARLTTAGVLDSTFGTGGILSVSLGTQDILYGLRIQSDGKILAAGSVDEQFSVVRALPSNTDFVNILSPANGSTLTSSTFAMTGNASQAGMTVRIKLGDVVIGTATTDDNGNWDAGISPVIANGSRTITVELLNGQASLATASSTFTINASTDTLVIASPEYGGLITTVNPWLYGYSSQSGKTVRIKSDGTVIASGLTNSTGQWDFSRSCTLENGDQTLVGELLDGETVLVTHEHPIHVQAAAVCADLLVFGGTFTTRNPPVTITGSGISCPPRCDFRVKKVGSDLFELTLFPVLLYAPTFFLTAEKPDSNGATVTIKERLATNKILLQLQGKADEISFAASSCRG